MAGTGVAVLVGAVPGCGCGAWLAMAMMRYGAISPDQDLAALPKDAASAGALTGIGEGVVREPSTLS